MNDSTSTLDGNDAALLQRIRAFLSLPSKRERKRRLGNRNKKPGDRHAPRIAKAARKRHAANKLARRQRRINRMRQNPHTRKRS